MVNKQGHSMENQQEELNNTHFYQELGHYNHHHQEENSIVIPNPSNSITTRSLIPGLSPPPYNHGVHHHGAVLPPTQLPSTSTANLHQYDMFHIPLNSTHKIKKPSKTSQQYGSTPTMHLHNQRFTSMNQHPHNTSIQQLNNHSNISTIRKNKPLLFHNIQYDSTSLKPSLQTVLAHSPSLNTSQDSFSTPQRQQILQITTTDPVPQIHYQKQNKQHHHITPIQSHSFIDSTYLPSRSSSKKLNNQDGASQSCMFHWKVQSTNYSASSSSSSNSSSKANIALSKSTGSPTIPPIINSNPSNNSNQFPLLSSNPQTNTTYPKMSEHQQVKVPHHPTNQDSSRIASEKVNNNSIHNPNTQIQEREHNYSVQANTYPLQDNAQHLPKDTEPSNRCLRPTELDKSLLNQNSTNKEEKRAKTNRTRISISELL